MRESLHLALRGLASAWRRLRPLVGDSWMQMGVLSAASALTGVVEAALLGLIVQIAVTLSGGARVAALSMGSVSFQLGLWTLLGVAAGLALLRLLLQFLVAWLPARIAADVQARLRRDLFQSFVRAEWAVQASVREGHLQDLMTLHTWRAALAVLTLTTGLAALLTLIALLAGAFAIGTGTAAFLLGVTVTMFLLLRPLGRLQRRLARLTSTTGLDLAAIVTEASRMAEEHHVFGTGDAQSRTVAAHVEAHRLPFFRSQLVARIAPAAYQSVTILLLVAGLAVLAALPVPELAVLGTVVLILVRSLSYGQQVQASYTGLNELIPFVERVEQAITQFRDRAVPAGAKSLGKFENLTFDGVGFAYRPSHPVLRGVNVRIEAGRAIAIVGPSGAGKSTLVQLLLRLREPDEGRILVNGVAVEEIRWADWNRLVAYVPQDPKLIRGTVADNIRFFRDISQEDVIAASRAAHIHGEILSDLGGYDVVIDHRGDTTSGGQRQRICLARALAGHPQLLVLDEPTSALDSRSEELILVTLRELRGEMSIVVVAHRPALVENCDVVWKVRDGRVTSQATEPLQPYISGNPRLGRTTT